MSDSEPYVSVSGLGVEYPTPQGNVTVIHSLDLHASAGQFVCLSGRSGSGKTSVLRVIAGLAAASSGSVSWNGTDTAQMNADALADLRRQLVGYMDQDAGLLPELTTLENCMLASLPDGRAESRKARNRSLVILQELGLEPRLRWRPRQLSGGERQRVVLARVLTARTPAIVADEPTASLDRSWADRVITKLRSHADQGGLIIAASHDPEIARTADLVIHLE